MGLDGNLVNQHPENGLRQDATLRRWPGTGRASKTLFSLALACLLFLAFSVVADRVLILFGFPTEMKRRYAHPPNYREYRKNIEFEYPFRTNSEGLRYREIPLEKPGSTHRIFVVGDSMTEGEGVSEEQRFSSLLENDFSSEKGAVNFINGGLSGTAPLEYGGIFFNVGMKYHPDGLLICLFANDLANTPEGMPPAYLEHYFFPESIPARSGMTRVVHLLWPRTDAFVRTMRFVYDYRRRTKTSDFVATISKHAEEIGIPKERIDEWRARLPKALVDAVNRGQFNGSILTYGLLYPSYWTDALDIDNPAAERKWQSYDQILSEIVYSSRRQGVDVAVVFIPDSMQFDPRRFAPGGDNVGRQVGIHVRENWLHEKSEVQKRIERWARDKSVPYLDLTEALKAAVDNGDTLNYPLDGHLNPKGHSVAAAAIKEWITEKNVFPFITKGTTAFKGTSASG